MKVLLYAVFKDHESRLSTGAVAFPIGMRTAAEVVPSKLSSAVCDSYLPGGRTLAQPYKGGANDV